MRKTLRLLCLACVTVTHTSILCPSNYTSEWLSYKSEKPPNFVPEKFMQRDHVFGYLKNGKYVTLGDNNDKFPYIHTTAYYQQSKGICH